MVLASFKESTKPSVVSPTPSLVTNPKRVRDWLMTFAKSLICKCPKLVETVILPMSSKLKEAVWILTKKVSPSLSTRPAPLFLKFTLTASSKSEMLTPSLAMSLKSGTTTNALLKPPIELTSATPLIILNCGRITKSKSCRFSISVILPSMVNIKMSDNGVTMGAMPPSTPMGKSFITLLKRSLTMFLAK